MNLSQQEKEEFKLEALEMIECAERNFLELEEGGQLSQRYDEVFRSLHNLKGAASMMDLLTLKNLVHEMETEFISFKNRPEIDKATLSGLIANIDFCRQLLINDLAEILGQLYSLNQQWGQQLENAELMNKIREDFESLSLLSQKNNESIFIVCSVVLRCLVSKLEVKQKFIIESKGLELISKIIELMNTGVTIDECRSISIKFREAVEGKLTEALVPVAKVVPATKGESNSIRVAVGLLDNLLNLMGELVLVRNQVLQLCDQKQHHDLAVVTKKLHLVTTEIQEQMMKTRMQPIGVVLEKMNRVVRDISKELGKKITLHLEGVDTEVDRTLLEAIKDPLTHIIRNACDHGIETPKERLEKNKTENSILRINAYQESGQVFIDIIDDGRGLNKERIREKAIKNNLVREDQVHTLSDKEIYNFIFNAGFSTAEVVTDVSGRGVGMDVVKTNIEGINGTIEIQSAKNKGSTFRIKIPLTLAIIPVLTVTVENQVFSIPQSRLIELINLPVTSPDISNLLGEPILNYRGNIIPLIYLSDYLFEVRKVVEEQFIVIVSHEESVFALAVDQIQETFDIVIKPLPKVIKNSGLYSGATILGDGTISLILDLSGIAQQIGAKPRRIMEKETKNNKVIQSLLVFKVGGSDYALSMNYINRIEEVKKCEISKSGSYDVLEYRGELLPLIYMDIHFNCSYTSAADTLKIIVIDRGGKLYGIAADSIYDALETQSDLIPPVNNEEGIFGSLKIQDKFYSVIDPFYLISKWKGEEVEISKTSFEDADRHTVLIVEDISFFRQAIKKALEDRGFKTYLAEDGEEALAILERHQEEITIILSDIEMPRLNGYQFAKTVRANDNYKHIPLIAVTSRASQENQKLGVEAGFDAFLEKLRPDYIINTIKEIFSKRTAA